MFHPNVYASGQICLDILQNQWSPIYDIAAILTSIQSLLTDPNPNSPANVEAAKLYNENRREYDRKVMEYVEASWTWAFKTRGRLSRLVWFRFVRRVLFVCKLLQFILRLFGSVLASHPPYWRHASAWDGCTSSV